MITKQQMPSGIAKGSLNDTCILVPSWDGYQDVWAPFFHGFFKYWPDCPYPVYLGANETVFNDPRVRMVRVESGAAYSTSLIAFLKQIPHQWVIVWVEDLFLKAPIDTNSLNNLLVWATEAEVSHVRLWAGPNSLISLAASKHPVVTLPEIGFVPKKARYRAGLTVGLWNKNTLKGLLRSGESAWDFESAGSLRSDSISEPLYSVIPCGDKNNMLKVVNSVRKGLWTIDGVRFLRREGLDDVIGRRPIESRLNYEYIMRFKLPFREMIFKARLGKRS